MKQLLKKIIFKSPWIFLAWWRTIALNSPLWFMMSIIYNSVLQHLQLWYNECHRQATTHGYKTTVCLKGSYSFKNKSLLQIWKPYGGERKYIGFLLRVWMPSAIHPLAKKHQTRGLNTLRQVPELSIQGMRLLALGSCVLLRTRWHKINK